MVNEKPTISESCSGKKLGFFSKVGSARAVRAAGGAPVVVVRLPPSKMRAESNGVRADSEAMHSETRARANKQRRRFRCQRAFNRARQRSEYM